MIASNSQRFSRFRKMKIIVILIYFILNAFLLILAFRMDINDLKFLVKMARYIPYFRYIASINLVMILMVILMHYIEVRNLVKKHKTTEQDLVNVKSRLYDLEVEKKEMIKKSTQDKLL